MAREAGEMAWIDAFYFGRPALRRLAPASTPPGKLIHHPCLRRKLRHRQ